jgi:hypothetical protein
MKKISNLNFFFRTKKDNQRRRKFNSTKNHKESKEMRKEIETIQSKKESK